MVEYNHTQRQLTKTLRRPARVLFLHPSNELYGSDLVLLNLLRGLDRHAIEPIVVLANDLNYEGLLSQEITASGIECLSLPIAVIRRKYFKPAGMAQFITRLYTSSRMIGRLIKEKQIDLVHSNTLAVWTGALAARRMHVPHIWHIHEMIERPPQLNTFMQRFVPSHSTHVVSVCQAGLDHVLTTPSARQKGMVLYNGLNPDEWMHAAGREHIRAELGCQPGDVLMGMVARISSFKAPDVFVEAVVSLLGGYPNLRCFIAGSPVPGQTDMIERLEHLIATSPAPDRIRLLGFRRDTPDLMAGLDVLVQPSRDPEMCSMTILQGMFAGKPVVATDVGGNKELVAQGETGLLVPKENVPALANALAHMIDQPAQRQAMGQAGLRRAHEHFTLDHQVQVFNRLLWESYVTFVRNDRKVI